MSGKSHGKGLLDNVCGICIRIDSYQDTEGLRPCKMGHVTILMKEGMDSNKTKKLYYSQKSPVLSSSMARSNHCLDWHTRYQNKKMNGVKL